jgi:hypothetical protein
MTATTVAAVIDATITADRALCGTARRRACGEMTESVGNGRGRGPMPVSGTPMLRWLVHAAACCCTCRGHRLNPAPRADGFAWQPSDASVWCGEVVCSSVIRTSSFRSWCLTYSTDRRE